MDKQPRKRPEYRIAEYQRAPLKFPPETAWKLWCEYRYTDKKLKDIVLDYDVSVPNLYLIGERFGDKFRRGRGTHMSCPLTPAQMERMWRDYEKGGLTLWQLEDKYGVGIQWVYKYANEHKGGARRRPDQVPRTLKKALTEKQELAAWTSYEKGRMLVDEIIEKYGIDRSTLYDIGDRLGSTFRRHKSSAGKAVENRVRFRRNMQGVDEE